MDKEFSAAVARIVSLAKTEGQAELRGRIFELLKKAKEEGLDAKNNWLVGALTALVNE